MSTPGLPSGGGGLEQDNISSPPNPDPLGSPRRKLGAIAFGEMNPFPGRLLRSRRALQRQRLEAELQALQEQQGAAAKERAERRDKDLDTGASEDEDQP